MGQEANLYENGASHGSSSMDESMIEAQAKTAPERIGRRLMINRKDHLRILQQALRKLGYPSVAERLERESGVQMQSASAYQFQDAILDGRFDEAVSLLPSLLESRSTLKQAKFRILQQKFVEQISNRQVDKALQILRRELVPLQINSRDIKRLSGYLLQRSEDTEQVSLKQTAWHKRRTDTRESLLQDLQRKLPPDQLLSEGRLEALLEQALQAQIDECVYHNNLHPKPSLFREYNVGREELPVYFYKNLVGHTDEVWHVQFSHLGDRLASASKDQTAIIWSMPGDAEAKILHVLRGHPDHVTHLTWSKDDSKMLTCSSNEGIPTFANFLRESNVLPEGEDLEHSAWAVPRKIFMCDLEGHALRQWTMKDRVNDIVITANSQLIVCITADKSIELMRLNDFVPVASIGDDGSSTPSAITSITITSGGEYLLANFKDHTTHLWHLGPIARRITRPLPEGKDIHPYGIAAQEAGDTAIEDRPLMEYHPYEGNRPEGRYVIRSCFGGVKSAFVASGSEDWKVYIWHRNTGETLAQLEGHTGTVNGVSWNPVHPYMLASASDDTTIGIWMAPIELCRQFPANPTFRDLAQGLHANAPHMQWRTVA